MIIAETKMPEMPKACTDCDLFRVSNLECPVKGIWFGKEDTNWLHRDRPNWCPLVEVEKMKEVKVVDNED